MSNTSDEVLTLERADDGEATLAERAFSIVGSMILDGDLAPGEVINEADMARRLSMTRGPVREALLRLEGRKLITREAYQRARVVELGPRQMKEIFEFREGVESVACRLATLNMSDESLLALEARLEAKKLGQDPGFDLHWEVASACGNTRVAKTLCDEIYHLVRMYRRRSVTNPQRPEESYAEHRHIVRAMLARDAELAESRMRMHIRVAASNLANLL